MPCRESVEEPKRSFRKNRTGSAVGPKQVTRFGVGERGEGDGRIKTSCRQD